MFFVSYSGETVIHRIPLRNSKTKQNETATVCKKLKDQLLSLVVLPACIVFVFLVLYNKVYKNCFNKVGQQV